MKAIAASRGGFYQITEGFYNFGTNLRAAVEKDLLARGMTARPMTLQGFSPIVKELANKYGTKFLPRQEAQLWELLDQQNLGMMIRRKLSPGIAYRPAPLPLSLEKSSDQFDTNMSANYAAPQGAGMATAALRTLEGVLLKREPLPDGSIFITEGGATNGIFSAMEFLRSQNKADLLALGPSYFQFYSTPKDQRIRTCIGRGALEQGANTRFLPTVGKIEESLERETGALVLTQPSNPTGEFYSREELRDILELAKERDMYIIEDAAFEELVFPTYQEEFSSVAQVANEMGLLDRVVTVKSYSKGKNFPGERIGYIVATDSCAQDFLLQNLLRQRDCPSNMNQGMIVLDSLLRTGEVLQARNVKTPWEESLATFQGMTDAISIPLDKALLDIYVQQRQDDMSTYLQNMEWIREEFPVRADTKTAYNTLVRVPGVTAPLLNTALSLYATQGVETQWGPNFDNNTARWDRQLGPWLRITFSSDPSYLMSGLSRVRDGLEQIAQDSPMIEYKR